MRKLIVPMVASLVLCFGTISAAQDPSLVLYLPFDEGTGTVVNDFSGKGNNGNIVNELKWVEGISGTALEFQPGAGTNVGAGFVRVPDSPSLSPLKAITVSTWVYPKNLSADAVVIVCQWWGGDLSEVPAFDQKHLSWVMETHAASGKRVHAIMNWGDRGNSDTPVVTGKWQHLAFTWDGSTLNFYYNGEPDGTIEYVDTLFDSDEPVRVGRTDRDDFIFSGVIDEVKVYNRALTAQEIKSEAMKTYSPVESAGKLVTLWGAIRTGIGH